MSKIIIIIAFLSLGIFPLDFFYSGNFFLQTFSYRIQYKTLSQSIKVSISHIAIRTTPVKVSKDDFVFKYYFNVY